MNRTNRPAIAGLVATLGAVACIGGLAFGQSPKESKGGGAASPPTQAMPELPPGWTQEDMQACMEAGMPGEMHAALAESVGVWRGTSTMWMAPGAEPLTSECTFTVTPAMDGRFIRAEMTGEMPGMGPFNGFGIYGFNNVTGKFESVWIDSTSTAIMKATGERSSDGKTMSWAYEYTCPITKKPAVLREVERITGKDTKLLEIFGTDPKSGQEYKMMAIEFTRKAPASGGGGSGAARTPAQR